MAVSGPRLDHRHRAVLHHRADQPCAAPGDQHVYILIEPHELTGRLPVCRLDQLDRIRADPSLGKALLQLADDGLVRADGVAPAL